MTTQKMFNKGIYVLGINLKRDREADEKHISVSLLGNVRIEARFKKPLQEPITSIFYAEFPAHLEIDISRNANV